GWRRAVEAVARLVMVPVVIRVLAAAVEGVVLGSFRGDGVRGVLLDQRLAIGDRYLVIVRMDLAEGEEPVAVAAIIDERRLKRRLDPGYLGEIDVAAELLSCSGLEIEFPNPVAAYDDHPGLLRMGGVDEHFVVGHLLQSLWHRPVRQEFQCRDAEVAAEPVGAKAE